MENILPRVEGAWLKVCGWCHPGVTIFETRPEFRDRGLKLSHGICLECRDKLMKTVPGRVTTG